VNKVKEISVTRVSGGSRKRLTDLAAVEKKISLYVNSEFFASFMCTPTNIRELAAGYMFLEGLINGPEDIKSMEEKQGESISVGIEGISFMKERPLSPSEASGRFSAEEILELMKEFDSKSKIFRETGGVHSCALCGSRGMEAFFEDVGRHNAADKVIGYALLNGLDLDETYLMTSARISSETAVKLARAGIQMIVSRSAPTDFALEIAEAANITVAGFARGDSMNIYCGEQRIY
jgi:FdhD protein